MLTVLLSRSQQCLNPFTMLPVKGILGIYLTGSLAVRKFKTTSTMSVKFFLKRFKIDSKYREFKEKTENIFRFWDKCYYNLKMML